MVTTDIKHAVATGGMEVVWSKWMHTITPNMSWNAWKSHWTQVFQEKRELHKLAGMLFDGTVSSPAEADMGDNMITALDNLTNTSVKNNNTVKRLVINNKSLTDSLAD